MREHQFFEALKGRYPPREYAMVPQVRNGTGFQNRTRTADAIAISLWPSRGIDVNGFEFKDSRSDWLKELADSAKSEEIGRFCDFWWLVVGDPKICTLDELPKNWGMIAVDDGGTKIVRKAPRREAIPPTMTFLASVLKAAQDVVTGEDEIKARIQKAVNAVEVSSYESLRKARDEGRLAGSKDFETLAATVKEFEDDSGVKISRWGDNAEIGEAVKFVMDGGLSGIEERLHRIVKTCDEVKSVATKILQPEVADVISLGNNQRDSVRGGELSEL